MQSIKPQATNRILVIDDNPAIHHDFRKILVSEQDNRQLVDAAAAFFGTEDAAPEEQNLDVELDVAHQGQEGFEMVRTAVAEGKRYAVAFVDMRMPPGWDGLKTIEHLWQADPALQIVICSAYSDNTWADIFSRLGRSDRLLILKKPFDNSEVLQMVLTLCEKQRLAAESAAKMEELRQQKNQLNQQNLRLGQLVATAHKFVDNVSHEFRTPLTVIREYCSLICEGVLGDVNAEQTEFLDVIRSRVDDLNTMVDDMLDSSKLEAGLLAVHRVACSPGDVVTRPVEDLSRKAQIRGVQLELNIDDDLPSIYCDPEKAGRIVTNLVSNAIKFCDDRTGRVSVSVRQSENEKDVEFAVKDNGPGIEPAELSQLYNRFQQLGTCTQSSTKGFGLGLNIARELVDLNFGQISVESRAGSGTTFRFTLPVNDWEEIVSRYTGRLIRMDASAHVAVVDVTVDGPDTNEIDAFWRYTARPHDLTRRTADGEWRLLLYCQPGDVDEIIARFQSSHADVSRNRPRPLPALQFHKNLCAPASNAPALITATRDYCVGAT